MVHDAAPDPIGGLAMESTKMKVLYMITERGEKSFWTRVGTGFVNRDGSITLAIDAMPVSPTSKLQLRDYSPRDAEDGASRGNGGGDRPRDGRPEARP
jgi:hypothetical protein